jgi:hypothetical protein
MLKATIVFILMAIIIIVGIIAEVGLVYKIHPVFALPFIAFLVVTFGIMRKTDQKS